MTFKQERKQYCCIQLKIEKDLYDRIYKEGSTSKPKETVDNLIISTLIKKYMENKNEN